MPAVSDFCGTYARYKQVGCRCAPCTAAFMRSVPHGTASGYRHHGCRCDACRKHKRAASKIERGSADRAAPLTVEEIRAALVAYTEVNANLPRDSEVCEALGRSWGAVRQSLARTDQKTYAALLGLPAVERREVTTSRCVWTRPLILGAAQDFADRHGVWPSTSVLAGVDAFGGRSWAAAHRWLRQQGTSLAALATELRPAVSQEIAFEALVVAPRRVTKGRLHAAASAHAA
jgi:hypothetical protein